MIRLRPPSTGIRYTMSALASPVAGRSGTVLPIFVMSTRLSRCTRSPVNGDRSAFDVRDMGGNVAEWVADWYARAYPQETVDPVRDGRPETDPERVQRGLSWLGNVPRNARAAYRWSEPEESRCVNVGFRCARSLGP